jgi:hypothetical protein
MYYYALTTITVQELVALPVANLPKVVELKPLEAAIIFENKRIVSKVLSIISQILAC